MIIGKNMTKTNKLQTALLSLIPLMFMTAPASATGQLTVQVLGSGGPVANEGGRASAGYLISTDGTPRILMDVGGGTFQRLAETGINIKDMDHILLTHLHLDHTGDLGSMIKTIYFDSIQAFSRRSDPIHIYGPVNSDNVDYPATKEYADLHYAQPDGSDRYLNTFVGQISQGTSEFNYQGHDLNSTVSGATIETVISTDDGLVVTAIAVDHGPAPAVAYRIEYQGHVVVYSGDTASTSDNMITLAQDADILIYDTAITDTLPPNPFFRELHTTPRRIGEVARDANVPQLILSHLTPVTEPRIPEITRSIRSQMYTGDIVEANDLDIYELN